MGKAPTVDTVRTGNEIREFLTSRRARITPEQSGLPAYGGRRRVSGLRREEVALLAGISVEYYVQLERGSVRGVSEDVLEAVARALQLDLVLRADEPRPQEEDAEAQQRTASRDVLFHQDSLDVTAPVKTTRCVVVSRLGCIGKLRARISRASAENP